MNTVIKRQDDLRREFSALPDWEARYKRLIEHGKKLTATDDVDLHTDRWKVKGCQSQVWLKAERRADGTLRFIADSDALIVKGLVALLLEVYSDAQPQEILSAPPAFLKELGLDSNLSPSRANGLNSMFKQILLYATAFSMMPI